MLRIRFSWENRLPIPIYIFKRRGLVRIDAAARGLQCGPGPRVVGATLGEFWLLT